MSKDKNLTEKMAKLMDGYVKTTYITKVKEKDDREESIAVDIEGVHWLDLVATFRCVKLRGTSVFSQVLVSNKSSDSGHADAKQNKVDYNEAETRDDPLEQEGSQRESSRLAQAAEEGAEDEERDINRSQTWVIAVPLVLNLL